jgi:hypothetical protein
MGKTFKKNNEYSRKFEHFRKNKDKDKDNKKNKKFKGNPNESDWRQADSSDGDFE